MQIKNNHPNYLQNRWLIGIIKILLLVGCLFFLYKKFRNQPVDFFEMCLPDRSTQTIILVLIFMVLNWYLEALRWKASLQAFEPVSIVQAWNMVLGGLALNWVLPLTSGDLVARISQQQDKYKTTSAAMFNRGVMLIFTLILGMYGVSRLTITYQWNGWLSVLIVVGIIAAIYVFRKSLSKFLIYFREMGRHTFMKVVIISFVRYLVFTFQFYLLFKVFLPSVEAGLLIAGIGWIFLIRSALPLFFGGIGVREASGILFFEPYIDNLQLVIIPISMIWIINTVIPSLMGLVFVLRWKLSSLNY